MGDTPGIRLLLVDDHELFLAGLRSLLRGEPGLIVVGEAHNGNEALEAARKQPDIILLDLLLETETGPDFLPDLMKAAERARILVLTGVPDPELQLRAVCLGALGIVLKAEAPHILLNAIRKVHAGEAWLNPTMTATAMTRLQARHSGNFDAFFADGHVKAIQATETGASTQFSTTGKGPAVKIYTIGANGGFYAGKTECRGIPR